jgi:hypothetical protein
MVFGQKATEQILISDISPSIKVDLINSMVYKEGRVIRLEISNNSIIKDIKKLVVIKIAN